MKIAYLIGAYPTRTQTFIRHEIEALRALGHEIVTISVNQVGTAGLDEDERRQQAQTLYLKSMPLGQILGVVLRALATEPRVFLTLLLQGIVGARWDLRRMLRMGLYFVEALLVRELCERHGLRHLHVHFAVPWSNVAWQAIEFSRRVAPTERWRWSLTIHAVHDSFDDPPPVLAAKLASVERVVCISDHGRADLMRQADSRHWPRLFVNRCGIPLEHFPLRQPRTLPARARILTVGRLAPEKGQLLLIEAVADLRARGLDVACTIVGDGPLRDRLARRIDELGLGDRIELTGALPPADVAARLHGADVFCLPSFTEGVPISIMEAMAVGVPVVATDVGGVSELVDGETGRLVTPGRVDLLATAIADLLGDATLREQIIRAGRARIERDHVLAPNAAHLARILEDLPC